MNAITVDIGNTALKFARYENDTLVDFGICDTEQSLISYLENFKFTTIVSAVGKEEMLREYAESALFKIFFLNREMAWPFESEYDLSTLGFDRIALIAGMLHEFPSTALLGIDAGTCITYDYISSNQIHLGGAIAPGIRLRFSSMHSNTAHLPFIQKIENVAIIGTSTQHAMESGVVNGVIAEINHRIIEFQQKEPNLQVVICGGDAEFLQPFLLGSIIYSPQIVSKGLFSILKSNA